ncbi:MAG: BACON domain-containing protein [Candidatus Cryptobacteroides sp.]
MKSRFTLMLAVLALAASACEKQEETGKPEETVLEVSGISSAQNVPCGQGTVTFTVKSNYAWEIADVTGTWLEFDKMSGQAREGTVTASFTANEGEDSRRSSFNVKSGDKEECFTVIQAGKEPEEIVPGIEVKGVDKKIEVDCQEKELEFTVLSNCLWNIDVTKLTFTGIAPDSGIPGETVTVKMKISANMAKQSRTDKFTISYGDKTDEYEILQSEYVPDPGDYDTHGPGYVFFSDDFKWVADTWSDNYPKYGWVSIKIDGVANNEYPIQNVAAAKDAADAEGYTYSDCCYAKAEGFIKLGKSALLGYIATPALSDIDEGKLATLNVEFLTGLYCSSGRVPDTYQFIQVSVEGDGVIASGGTEGLIVSEDGKSAQVPVSVDDDHIWVWTRKQLVISGATSATSIKFGSSDAVKGRVFLDDIKITRSEESGSAAADEIVVPDLSWAASIENEGAITAGGGRFNAGIRVNRAWTVETDADWLTIDQIKCNTDATLVEISDDRRTATVPGTALPYNNTYFSVAANESAESRSANVTIKTAGGQQVTTLKVEQEGLKLNTTVLAKWSFTGLYTDYTASKVDYTNPDPVLDAIAVDWIRGTHTFNSDAVTGGIFTAHTTHSSAAYSTGTGGQVKDRLRIKGMCKDDYFSFSVSGLTAAAGSTISFKGVGVSNTNTGTAPCEFVEEYSLDGGETWNFVRNLDITESNTPVNMACDIAVNEALDNATLVLRARIRSNNTASGTFNDNGTSNIAMILLTENSRIGTGVGDRDTHYTDDWAYAMFTLTSK